ncbi:MAG: HAMP domain-containing sensor histidine kinase [Myxococcales bacterium]|nr:HAMP domain-containing histidine kinase [Polyangiaceae bacterium]MDW8247906.1 HAMP domain-containing sensor histidine kinase [Myxococcales bacterium]
MTTARLISYVVVLQVLVTLGAFTVYGLGAPWLLFLNSEQTRYTLVQTLYMSSITELASLFLIWRRLQRAQYTLRALDLGSRAFELEELAALSTIPTHVVRVTLASAILAALSTLPSFVRAGGVDLVVGMDLFLLLVLVIVAAGLPLYALVRGAVSKALERAPPDAAGESLALLERDGIPRQHTLLHMVAAVVIPLAFVAVGAALVTHARVRSAASEARVDLAISLARAVGEDLPGAIPDAGRGEALRLARAEQISLRFRSIPAPYSVRPEEDGSLVVTVPLSEQHAQVTLRGGSGAGVIPWALLSSLMFLCLALWGGWRLGRALAEDLSDAALQVRQLGNERVLQGGSPIQRPAWFRPVAGLGRALERLADRFRIFAAAQERAIEAREAALRLRGLLFASVSHDLKSPLNAILGFSALAALEPLNDAQQESVAIIERRGRELLALLETILDAARVEAQQLTLVRASCSVRAVVERALEKADDLAPLGAAPAEVLLDDDIPEVCWDDARVAQALAALLGHARRLSPSGGVRVEGTLDMGAVELLVYEPSGKFSVGEVAWLLDSANTTLAPRRLGGLALGLGLARSLVRLHGGALDVQEAEGGGVVFRLRLPIGTAPPTQDEPLTERRGTTTPCPILPTPR